MGPGYGPLPPSQGSEGWALGLYGAETGYIRGRPLRAHTIGDHVTTLRVGVRRILAVFNGLQVRVGRSPNPKACNESFASKDPLSPSNLS